MNNNLLNKEENIFSKVQIITQMISNCESPDCDSIGLENCEICGRFFCEICFETHAEQCEGKQEDKYYENKKDPLEKKARKKRSAVWNHFTLQDEKYAICKLCGHVSTYISSNGTGGLRSHISRCLLSKAPENMIDASNNLNKSDIDEASEKPVGEKIKATGKIKVKKENGDILLTSAVVDESSGGVIVKKERECSFANKTALTTTSTALPLSVTNNNTNARSITAHSSNKSSTITIPNTPPTITLSTLYFFLLQYHLPYTLLQNSSFLLAMYTLMTTGQLLMTPSLTNSTNNTSNTVLSTVFAGLGNGHNTGNNAKKANLEELTMLMNGYTRQQILSTNQLYYTTYLTTLKQLLTHEICSSFTITGSTGSTGTCMSTTNANDTALVIHDHSKEHKYGKKVHLSVYPILSNKTSQLYLILKIHYLHNTTTTTTTNANANKWDLREYVIGIIPLYSYNTTTNTNNTSTTSTNTSSAALATSTTTDSNNKIGYEDQIVQQMLLTLQSYHLIDKLMSIQWDISFLSPCITASHSHSHSHSHDDHDTHHDHHHHDDNMHMHMHMNDVMQQFTKQYNALLPPLPTNTTTTSTTTTSNTSNDSELIHNKCCLQYFYSLLTSTFLPILSTTIVKLRMMISQLRNSPLLQETYLNILHLHTIQSQSQSKDKPNKHHKHHHYTSKELIQQLMTSTTLPTTTTTTNNTPNTNTNGIPSITPQANHIFPSLDHPLTHWLSTIEMIQYSIYYTTVIQSYSYYILHSSHSQYHDIQSFYHLHKEYILTNNDYYLLHQVDMLLKSIIMTMDVLSSSTNSCLLASQASSCHGGLGISAYHSKNPSDQPPVPSRNVYNTITNTTNTINTSTSDNTSDNSDHNHSSCRYHGHTIHLVYPTLHDYAMVLTNFQITMKNELHTTNTTNTTTTSDTNDSDEKEVEEEEVIDRKEIQSQLYQLSEDLLISYNQFFTTELMEYYLIGLILDPGCKLEYIQDIVGIEKRVEYEKMFKKYVITQLLPVLMHNHTHHNTTNTNSNSSNSSNSSNTTILPSSLSTSNASSFAQDKYMKRRRLNNNQTVLTGTTGTHTADSESHLPHQQQALLEQGILYEIESYLTSSLLLNDEKAFNIWSWWELHSSTYPYLTQFVQEYLAMPTCLVLVSGMYQLPTVTRMDTSMQHGTMGLITHTFHEEHYQLNQEEHVNIPPEEMAKVLLTEEIYATCQRYSFPLPTI